MVLLAARVSSAARREASGGREGHELDGRGGHVTGLVGHVTAAARVHRFADRWRGQGSVIAVFLKESGY